MTPARLFWPAYALVSAVVLGGMLFGAQVELAVAPVLSGGRASDVTRTEVQMPGFDFKVGLLCWRWEVVKHRPQSSFPTAIGVWVSWQGDRSPGSIFNEGTGAPVTRSAASPKGPVDRRWCLMLPPAVKATDAVRVDYDAGYPGLLGLWTLPVHFPTIIDQPPAPP